MSERRLPVRPDLRQLKIQAKELQRAQPGMKLAEAQRRLAREYDAPSWMRLVQACRLADAIWDDDLAAVERLITSNPHLIHEAVLIRESNWGRPMSYAANIGRNEIIELLHARGARDLDHALDRAALQGQVETVRLLQRWRGEAPLPSDILEGPAYTLNAAGTRQMIDLGADMSPVLIRIVLESDSRKPADKHAILEMYASHGLALPDTPAMALHRGRIDLLEKHLQRDPKLLERRFAFEEIYPPEYGCSEESATYGTTIHGTSLLHIAVDYDELEIARWLIERGMDVNIRATVDDEGFGGHTPLFSSVVAQPNYGIHRGWRRDDARFTRLLLAHGADPHVRASLRKKLHPGYGPDTMHEYRDVTPAEWGERFHDQRFVSKTSIALLR